MVAPLEFLKARINEIQQQYDICLENDCDAEEVRMYLLEYQYAHKLLKDFGFLPKRGGRSHTKKLTYMDVKNIRKYFNPDAGRYSPYSAYGLAYEHKVHLDTIYKVLRHDTWKKAS